MRTRRWSPSSAPACRPAYVRRRRTAATTIRSWRALSWLTEVTGTRSVGWPLAEVPVKLSESPAYIGGRIDRGAPGYGEDNNYVYGELLGMSPQEIKALAEEGVI